MESHYDSLREELAFVGANSTTVLIALGGDVYRLLGKQAKTGLRVVKALHYSFYIGEQAYADRFTADLEDQSISIRGGD